MSQKNKRQKKTTKCYIFLIRFILFKFKSINKNVYYNCSVQEHPDALFCEGHILLGHTGGGRRKKRRKRSRRKAGASATSAMTRHLHSGKDRKWSPSWPHISVSQKAGGGEGGGFKLD